MKAPQTPRERYRAHRYYYLSELRTTRARFRVGTASPANCAKDRKHWQRQLASIRAERKSPLG